MFEYEYRSTRMLTPRFVEFRSQVCRDWHDQSPFQLLILNPTRLRRGVLALWRTVLGGGDRILGPRPSFPSVPGRSIGVFAKSLAADTWR